MRQALLNIQCRRLHGAGGGTCPHFYKWLGMGGTMSRRTANKKLTKLYWPSRKRSPKQLIVLLEPKKWRGTTKKKFPALRTGSVTPTFKFVPAPQWIFYLRAQRSNTPFTLIPFSQRFWDSTNTLVGRRQRLSCGRSRGRFTFWLRSIRFLRGLRDSIFEVSFGSLLSQKLRELRTEPHKWKSGIRQVDKLTVPTATDGLRG